MITDDKQTSSSEDSSLTESPQQWRISLKAHKACAWSVKFLKGGTEQQTFEIFFLTIIKNFYTLVKLKKNPCQLPLSSDSEHYAIQFAIVYLREIAKI